jgi:hypothetical protein
MLKLSQCLIRSHFCIIADDGKVSKFPIRIRRVYLTKGFLACNELPVSPKFRFLRASRRRVSLLDCSRLVYRLLNPPGFQLAIFRIKNRRFELAGNVRGPTPLWYAYRMFLPTPNSLNLRNLRDLWFISISEEIFPIRILH